MNIIFFCFFNFDVLMKKKSFKYRSSSPASSSTTLKKPAKHWNSVWKDFSPLFCSTMSWKNIRLPLDYSFLSFLIWRQIRGKNLFIVNIKNYLLRFALFTMPKMILCAEYQKIELIKVIINCIHAPFFPFFCAYGIRTKHKASLVSIKTASAWRYYAIAAKSVRFKTRTLPQNPIKHTLLISMFEA